MKNLYLILFSMLLSVLGIVVHAKTPLEGLTDALEKTSSEGLQQGRDVRWELNTRHPNAGFGSMATSFDNALNTLKNKGVIPREKPSPSTKIHQWTYLCSHNAFSSKAHGYGLYKQQNLSMTEQLNRGARALMLDAWLANDIIRLTHGEPKYDKVLRGLAGTDFFIGLFQEGMHMEKELKKLKEEFFDKPENKGEVVFIILEDYIDNRGLMDQTLEKTGLASKILKPSEWDPVAKGGWPTFKWMEDNNKQLVIFSSKGKTKYLYPQWQNMYENQYGVLTDKGAAQQRGDSTKYNKNKRYFFLFNFFEDYAEKAFGDVGSFSDAVLGAVDFLKKLDYMHINGNRLSEAINYSFISGPDLVRGRYPNFIAIDFVEQAYKNGEGPYKVVDEVNRKGRTNPGKFYRPIQ